MSAGDVNIKPKIIAMYLPQFHAVPENDKWWGKGYTEWAAVKNGKKYDDRQNQPRIPMKENYYNLLEPETMQWQADLAARYNVYGFAFYHYWFKDGRKILEKPAENLLKWKNINMNFCFSWANESWARTWSNLTSKNSWVDDIVDDTHEGDGILLLQDYGAEKEWRDHYVYVREFFRDKRYIKVDGKPLFIIYRPDEIACINEMIGKWNLWAREDGFDGVYFIATNPQVFNPKFDARLLQEPKNALSNISENEWSGTLRVYDYEKAWKKIINRLPDKNIKTYYGGFSDYDDTARHGVRGTFFKNVSKEKFRYYLEKLTAKNLSEQNEFIFINAWNEWGEGMYLEPDSNNEYGFLEAVREVTVSDTVYNSIDQIQQVALEQILEDYIERIDYLDKRYNKFYEYFNILNTWLILKEEKKNFGIFFEQNHFNKVAIYGMGVMGRHLLRELKECRITVAYGIDRFSEMMQSEILIKGFDESYYDVDVVVVTATFEFDQIVKKLNGKCVCPVISLKQVADYCMSHYFNGY